MSVPAILAVSTAIVWFKIHMAGALYVTSKVPDVCEEREISNAKY